MGKKHSSTTPDDNSSKKQRLEHESMTTTNPTRTVLRDEEQVMTPTESSLEKLNSSKTKSTENSLTEGQSLVIQPTTDDLEKLDSSISKPTPTTTNNVNAEEVGNITTVDLDKLNSSFSKPSISTSDVAISLNKDIETEPPMYALQDGEYWSSSGAENFETDDDNDEHSVLSKQQKSSASEEHTDNIQKPTTETTIEGNTTISDTMVTDVQVIDKTHDVASAEFSPNAHNTTTSTKKRKTRNSNRNQDIELTQTATADVDEEVPIFKMADESIQTINLLMLSMLVHSTDDCLVNQPTANYRSLRILDLKAKKFIDAMTEPNQDIMEEMYAFLYEITTEENEYTLPIHPCYSTSEKDNRTQLPVFAKFPTDSALKDMAKAYGITKNFTTEAAQLTGEIFHELSTVQPKLHDKIYFTTVKYKSVEQTIPAKSLKIHDNYLTLRQDFQSKHKIRVAILGGLHRTSLALHIMGNYMIHNNTPAHYSRTTYSINQNSSINSQIAIHIFTSKELQLNNNFLESSQFYSEQVNDRKKKGIEMTVRGQLHDLLDKKSNDDINKQRFIPSTVLAGSDVSYKSKKTCFQFF